MISHFLNRTCTIYRKSTSASSISIQINWNALSSSVPYARQVASGSESLQFQKETGDVVYDLFFKYGQDITNADKIIDDDDGLVVHCVTPALDDAGMQAYTYLAGRWTEGIT